MNREIPALSFLAVVSNFTQARWLHVLANSIVGYINQSMTLFTNIRRNLCLVESYSKSVVLI